MPANTKILNWSKYSSMKVGDHVKHRDRPDVGIGVIEEFFNNHCTVRFKEETFTGVPWQSFKLAEQEFQDEKRRIEREARGEKERKERQERALKRRKKLEAAEQQKREPIQSRMREILNKDFLNADTLVVGVDPDGLVDYPSLKVAWMKEKFQSILSEPEPNDEQLLAIGDFSKSTLVRARAGSGKTTVIKRKTSLLLTHLGVQSSEILVLAFNRAAADKINLDMQTKPESRFFTNAKTFHSLAHGIVSPSRDSILFDPPSKVRGPRYAFVEEILRKDDNPALLSDLYQFFRAEYSEIERIGALTSDQEYYTNLRNMEEETLGGDMVKY